MRPKRFAVVQSDGAVLERHEDELQAQYACDMLSLHERLCFARCLKGDPHAVAAWGSRRPFTYHVEER